MGFVPIDDDLLTPRLPLGKDVTPERADTLAPSPLGPAFRTENIIGSWWSRLSTPGQFGHDPNHNPLDILKGTKYEDDPDFMIGSESDMESRMRLLQRVREDRDKEIENSSGLPGMVAQFAAGTLDPSIAFPGGAMVKSAKGGYELARSAISVARAGAVAVGAQEALLQQTQVGRTTQESLMNIGTATLFAGLLGAGVAKWATKAERVAGIKALDSIRDELSAKPALKPEYTELADADGTVEIVKEGKGVYKGPRPLPGSPEFEQFYELPQRGGTGLAAPGGSAASDTRELVPRTMVPPVVSKAYETVRGGLRRAGELPLVRDVPGLRNVVGGAGKLAAGILGVPEALIKKSGPLTRMAYSASTAAKRAAFDLVESPLEFKDNEIGVPTSRNGPAVETTARIAIDGTRFKLTKELDRLYKEYYFGQATKFGKLKARIDQVRGTTEGRLDFRKFKAEVADALRNGDTHETIPEAQAAAQFLRKEVFDPWKEAAIRLKLLPEDVTVKTAQSYFMRVYNKEKIAAERPTFIQRVSDWLEQDQGTKAQLKNDLQGNRDLRAERTRALRKVEKRLETIQARQDEVEARLGERTMETDRAGKRVDALKERAKASTDELTDLDEVIRDLKDTVRDPELKAELQQLERELVQLKRADKPLTEKDLAAIEKDEEESILSGPMRKAARIASGQVKAPKVPSFAGYLVKEGGIKDTGGEVLYTMGDAKTVPGIISGKGRSLEQWGEKLTQDFPEIFDERPSADTILDLLRESAAGRQPDWFIQAKMPPADLQAMQMAAALEKAADDAGIDLKSSADVAALFRGEDTGITRNLDDLLTEINKMGGLEEPQADFALNASKDPYRESPVTTTTGHYAHLGEFTVKDPHNIGIEARRYVIDQGKKAGDKEAILVFSGDGTKLADGTGTAGNVGWPEGVTFDIMTKGSDIIVHHNHPRSSSFSAADLELLSFHGMSVIWAHGSDDFHVYRASLPPALRNLDPNKVRVAIRTAYEKAGDALYPILRKLALDGAIPVELANQLHHHLQVQGLHNAGLIDYMTNRVAALPAHLGLMDMLQKATDAARLVGEAHLNAHALSDARAPGRSARTIRHPGDVGIPSSLPGGPSRGGDQGGRAGLRKENDRAQAGRGEQLSLFEPAGDIESPGFKRFYAGSKVVDAEGNPVVLYHGSRRVDRIAKRGKFDKKRATSGPMAFLTDDPELASSYSKNKADTSAADEEHLAERFTIKVRGRDRRIDQAWYDIPADEKARISEMAGRIHLDDQGKIVVGSEGRTDGIGNYDYELKQAHGNHFRALTESWLHSGAIFGDEEKFLDVLKASGMKTPVEYFDSDFGAPGVIPVYASIKNPLDTANIPPEVADAIRKEAKGKRASGKFGVDMWDKRVMDPKMWMSRFEEGLKNPREAPFTVIPDWVTDTLRRFGYDGVKDTGGKTMGGKAHTVWVPFEEAQIKSVFNKGEFDPSNPNMLAEEEPRFAGPTSSPQFKKWFGESKLLDETGGPRVVYHGSPAKTIDQFRPEKIGTANDTGFYGRGFYFAGSKQLANDYRPDGPRGQLGAVQEVYLKIEKPFVWDLSTPELSDDTLRRIREIMPDANITTTGIGPRNGDYRKASKAKAAAEWTDALKAAGYDGVIVETKAIDTVPHEIVVFEPTQIKSVQNKGAFDPSNPNILAEDKPRYDREGFKAMIAEQKAETAAAQTEVMAALEKDGAFTASSKDGRSIMVTESLYEPGLYQISQFDKNGEPWGHYNVRKDELGQEVKSTLRDRGPNMLAEPDRSLPSPVSLESSDADLDAAFPLVKGETDGMIVRDGPIPNMSSIDGTISNAEVLPGVREVKIADFEDNVPPATPDRRTRDLAEAIRASNEITPLIVAIDDKGPYIIEGGHRFDALKMNGKKSFPAKVVLDLDALPERPTGMAEPDRSLPPFRDPTIPLRIQRESMEETVNVKRENIQALKAEIEKVRRSRASAAVKGGKTEVRKGEAELGAKANRGRRGVLQDRSSRLDTARELMTRAQQNVQKELDDLRLAAEEKLLSWDGKSAGDAKAALKRRTEAERIRDLKKEADVYQGKDERLTGADKSVDNAIKRIIRSDRDKTRPELESLASEITDRIIGSPDGRLSYDAASGGPNIGPPKEGPPPRGPLAHREFMIPDELIREWLHDDVEQIAHTYLGSLVPDVLLTERFGDVDMTQEFRKINEEYDALSRNADGPKARSALEKERQRVIGDLAAMRDRIRGTYGFTSDTVMKNAARIAGAAGNLNTLADMGGSALSQLPDLAGPIFRYGMGTVFRDGWMPFVENLGKSGKGAFGEAKRQYQAMGIAIDMVHNTRNLDEVGEQYHPRTKGERTLKAAAQGFMNINLSAPMTDVAKSIAAVVSGNEVLRGSKALAAGKATKKQITSLHAASIDEEMAGRIAASFDESGLVKDGVHLPNTADWSDQAARRAFEGAVSREVNIAVVTPGQEKALFLSNPILRILGQFKSFIASSTVRIMAANLQRRDAQVLQGLIGSIALGALGYKAYTMASGIEASDRWEDWLKEGVSRAGVLGWIDEGNSFASKFTRGQLDLYRAVGADKPLSRYASRGVLGALLGPTAGKIENAAQAVGALASGEFTGADTRASRRIVPLQNLFYIRGLLNQVEEGFNDKFGIPQRKQ